MNINKYFAETIGTFAMVFCGTGAMVINEVTRGSVTHIGIALTFGMIVMAMIYSLGEISGAHFNPAVTIGFSVAGKFPVKHVLPYFASQAIGAFAASAMLKYLFPQSITLGATIPSGTDMQSFWLELILTYFLMLVIMRVAHGSKETGMMAGIAIGSIIALEAAFAGPISGASMNPVRSLAPAVVSGHLSSIWIYLTAPFIGAVLAVLSNKYLLTTPNNPMKKNILFVCVENANRSQMAQAFARIYGVHTVEAYSAGSKPSGTINAKAIASMKEVGYDMSSHKSKSLDEIPDIEYDYVVTMGCGDACPYVKTKNRIDWDIPDPRDMDPEAFAEVRDLIARKVKELVEKI